MCTYCRIATLNDSRFPRSCIMMPGSTKPFVPGRRNPSLFRRHRERAHLRFRTQRSAPAVPAPHYVGHPDLRRELIGSGVLHRVVGIVQRAQERRDTRRVARGKEIVDRAVERRPAVITKRRHPCCHAPRLVSKLDGHVRGDLATADGAGGIQAAVRQLQTA